MAMPEKNPGRKVAQFIGRVMAGVLGFLIVLTIAVVVVYFADKAFGWGLLTQVSQLLRP